MKKAIYAVLLLLVLGGGVVLTNYILLARPVNSKINADPRNKGVELSAHYRYYMLPSALVLNLTNISGDHSQLDVFRTVLQASEVLKNKSFNEVILAFKGTNKFKIKGDYFKELGETYNSQNPLYTVRTFPENVLNLDGASPYEKLQGGAFGVFAGGMDQFSDLSKKWYGEDFASGDN
ncbi:hypothetical protein ACFQ3S_16125 [Mucilaginibacter terrae]|uniref:hypothetical protein n=1 Tax=Mucilaginibacter terrae TaxID=1955052 RepID=UPI00363F9B76